MTDIKMIRGTTFKQAIHIKYEGKDYVMKKNEIFRFGVKESGFSKKYLLIKEWTYKDIQNGVIILEINPTDTLKLPFKKYKYDLGLQSDEDYFMIIPESDFILCENITQWEENNEDSLGN